MTHDWTSRGREVLDIEMEGLHQVRANLGPDFSRAVELLLDCAGRVAVTGIGKSGLVGRKIAATLSSTGTPAFFLHPVEGAHGDLGVVREGDVVIAISYSGKTDELNALLPALRSLGARIIAITGNTTSALAALAEITLDASVPREACALNLAPTSSTTATLALGDALAMVLMDRRGFTREDFGLHHPGGALGMSLQSVREWMGDNAATPASVPMDADFSAVVSAVSAGRKGAVAVLHSDGSLAGMITDGDIRRAFTSDISALRAEDIMNRTPITVDPDARMSDVVDLLSANKIANLFVVENDRPVAIIHIAELMQAGYVS